jgi:Rrf2 family protein
MSKIFNISEAASIGIHCVALIAKHDEKLNVAKLSEMMSFSRHHVAKVMQRLVKSGFLKSNRGPSGGFVLNKKPDEITFLDIYTAIEGEIPIEDCPLNYEDCPFNKCLLDSIANDMILKFKEYLASRTIDYYVKNDY